jgi:hypothetical protein
VILDFAGVELKEVANAVSYGVWTAHHADEAGTPGEPWLFHPMCEGAVFRTSVETDRLGHQIVLYESYGASDWVSLHRGRNLACWKASSAILNRLRVLASAGWREVEDLSAPSDGEGEAERRPPSGFTVARHVARVAAGVAKRRLQKLLFRQDWFIATRARPAVLAPETTVTDFTPIACPPNHYFADPFPFIHGGRVYLFFESYSHSRRRASIWYAPLDSAGRLSGEPQPALERDYHLSYPFVFAHSGEIFMIPESAEHRTVELYRATRFPEEWRLEQTLFSDVRAVDATVYEADGRLFLFVNMAGDGASLDDELHLFWATHPSGPWQPHPANPVVADVRCARPAGRLFLSDGRLIRPSQDCSHGYGSAIVLNRIDLLTDREYRESVVRRIEPRWMPGISRTHTFNALDGLDVIDGVRSVLRHRSTRFLTFGRAQAR